MVLERVNQKSKMHICNFLLKCLFNLHITLFYTHQPPVHFCRGLRLHNEVIHNLGQLFSSFWSCLFRYNKTLWVYIGGQVMATPHNGIIKGNTVYNTILSLKLSYLHVLAHFIMWYTCISHIFYKVLHIACTVCICECVFQMHHSTVCPGRGCRTNP